MLINTSSFRRKYDGIQLVPPALVYPTRGILQNQGIDPKMLADNGEIDPQALVALAFNKVIVRTAMTPDIEIDLTQRGDGQVSQLVKDLQPVVILRGRAGEVKIAPAGEPSGINPNLQPAAVKTGLGIGAALLGLILIAKAIT